MKSKKMDSILKRGVALCSAIILTAGMLSGCGSSNKPASSTGDTSSSAGSSSAATTESGKDSLTVALTDEPDYLSTCEHDSLMGVQMNLLTYNGLVRIDMETLQPVCDLAESFTQDSDTEWTFKLKQGVLFQNGEEFTADDVAATIAYAQSFPSSATYTGAIASVEVVDPYTVKLVTSDPTPNLLYNLGYHFNFMLPKSLIDSGNDFSANPVGTGPYKLVEWNKGNYISFVANDDYFDADRKASIQNLKFSIIPEGATRTMALESGDVDFVYSVASNDIDRLTNTDGLAMEQVVSVENYFLYLNCVNTPFADENLRKAVSYAINRDDIVVGALNGYGTPSYSCVSMGYAESTDENGYGYDVDKAKQYLAAWGGDPSTVTLDIVCSNETKKAIATIMQAELAEIGINVTINEMDSASYQAIMTTTDLTSAIVSWSPSNALTYVQRFHSTRRDYTPACMADDDLDVLVEHANVCMDDAERAGEITNIIATVNDMCPFVPIYQVNYFRAHSADLQNVVCSATGYVDFSAMRWN
ncbi:MAG: ABC transporter substrate-binding protein [Oscillospiraceae bacterium]|nr:ABC transporter substrate-binding protein [Oscillospiraceae bacterium]